MCPQARDRPVNTAGTGCKPCSCQREGEVACAPVGGFRQVAIGRGDVQEVIVVDDRDIRRAAADGRAGTRAGERDGKAFVVFKRRVALYIYREGLAGLGGGKGHGTRRECAADKVAAAGGIAGTRAGERIADGVRAREVARALHGEGHGCAATVAFGHRRAGDQGEGRIIVADAAVDGTDQLFGAHGRAAELDAEAFVDFDDLVGAQGQGDDHAGYATGEGNVARGQRAGKEV